MRGMTVDAGDAAPLSHTARVVAGIRALDARKPAPEQLVGDRFAERFLEGDLAPAREFLAAKPEAEWNVLLRHRALDDWLTGQVTAGVSQVVLLAAGLDARAYRLAALAEGVTVFEIDQAAPLTRKRALVRRACGALPPHVVYLPLDLAAADPAAALAAAPGFRPGPTAVIMEGLTCYLPEAALASLLRRVGTLPVPRLALAFDYFDRTHPRRPETVAAIEAGGEALIGFFAPAAVAEWAGAAGFGPGTDRTVAALAAEYLDRPHPVAYFHLFQAAREGPAPGL